MKRRVGRKTLTLTWWLEEVALGCLIAGNVNSYRYMGTSAAVKGKGKVLPVQAYGAQRVLGRLRLPDPVISALEGGRFSAIRTGRLYPQDYPGTHFKRLSRPRGTWNCRMPRKKSPVTPPGIDPGTFPLVAQCFNHYVTPGSSKAQKCLCYTQSAGHMQYAKWFQGMYSWQNYQITDTGSQRTTEALVSMACLLTILQSVSFFQKFWPLMDPRVSLPWFMLSSFCM
jgi:hypothetical protein